MYDLVYSKFIHKELVLQQSNNASYWQQFSNGDHIIFVHPDISDPVSKDWFDANFWRKNNAITGESKGRHITYFIDHQQITGGCLEMVLRHYYRGGLVSKLLNDEFLYTGLDKTRAIAELNMLQAMRELDLPVPKPLVAMVTKVAGIYCRNDILIEKIPNAKDGFQWLLNNNLDTSIWHEIGATIKRFHHHGVYHSDLNIHNILIDNSGNVFIIDFDRCGFRTPALDWQQANLARLHRSLLKEQNLHPSFCFKQSDWLALQQGYNA